MDSQSDPNSLAANSSSRSSSPRYFSAAQGAQEAASPEAEAELAAGQGLSGLPKTLGSLPKSSPRKSSSPPWRAMERMGNYSALEKLMLLTCITVLVSNLAMLTLAVILIVGVLRQ